MRCRSRMRAPGDGRLPFVTRSSTLGLLVEVLLVLLGLGTILGGVSVFATCCIVAWIVLALIYVAIILWFAWCVRLVPDQTDTQETALVLPSWLVFLLGWTPVMSCSAPTRSLIRSPSCSPLTGTPR